ncbi:MAG: HD domain-containing protein [Solirubrobacteraceae bacterium]
MAGEGVQETVQEIVEACLSMAGLPYDGEPVDQLSHALQCAALAAAQAADDDEFVVACLLHDVARAPAVAGMQYDGPAEGAVAGEHHGEAAARWLAPRVGERVAWLAEQHVGAKRYLVATDAAYRDQLTEVSARTLQAQGGPMSDDEVASFRRQPGWELAVALRRIDDRGKVLGLDVPGIESYRSRLARVVAASASSPDTG